MYVMFVCVRDIQEPAGSGSLGEGGTRGVRDRTEQDFCFIWAHFLSLSVSYHVNVLLV